MAMLQENSWTYMMGLVGLQNQIWKPVMGKKCDASKFNSQYCYYFGVEDNKKVNYSVHCFFDDVNETEFGIVT